MKSLLIIAALFAVSIAGAQTKSVLKNINGGTITESLTIGSGKTLTIASGATINATGATITGFTASAAWGGITGTLSAQTDLNTALGLKSPLASPTFTGTPSLPLGTLFAGNGGSAFGMALIAEVSADTLRSTLSLASDGAVTFGSVEAANGTFTGDVGVTGNVVAGQLQGSGLFITALNASNLDSGIVATSRLGSGTANSTTYLRGDNTWAAVTGGVTSITGTANQITVTGTTTPTLSLPSAITGPTSVQIGATGTVGQIIAPSTSTFGMQLRAYNGIDFYNTQYGYSMGNVNGGTWNIANVYCSAGTKSTKMDTTYGFQCAAAATVGWSTSSNPSTAPDVALSRVSSGVLGVGTGASGATDGSVLAANLSTSVALKAGTNGTGIATLKHGNATLTAGTVTVSDSDVAAGSRIFINRQTDGGTVGDSYSITRSVGVSFSITSKTANATVTGDTSTVSYMLINP